ncbi:MAG TPA: hypothetical protein VF228_21700 [Iamia sp.]
MRPSPRLSRPSSPRSRDPEAGASILLALVLIFVIFGILTAVLSFAFAAARTTHLYDRDRALHFHADAALELAVVMVRNNYQLGEMSPTAPACLSKYAIAGTSSSPTDPKKLFVAGSSLNVECSVTPGVVNSGLEDPGTGRQRPRDVTFTVICFWDSLTPTDKALDCNDSNNDRMVLATARVRYEVDPGYSLPLQSARVPKIVSWQVYK